ncbi:MAG: asparagine synthase (glutamine-hydrolyzing) [Planctomycetota bacterium]|nr:asparagine synthase (glutamine-hydrolyzing) [Planctomycetota bacterium]
MCGIAGYLNIHEDVTGIETILRMTRAIAHRGPDDEGFIFIRSEDGAISEFFSDQSAEGARAGSPSGGDPRLDIIRKHRIAMGHRRFSIVDPTPGGHQPFFSADRRYCMTFNGEIYNYVELREELEREGIRFRTSSDTEVLIEAFRAWGTGCFERFVGFWGLALYDTQRKRLLLARDRIGKGSLYIHRTPQTLHWCTEIKGIRAVVGRENMPVREQAVADFVVCGHRDLFDETMYEGITTFPRASWAWINDDGSFTPQTYWSIPTQRLGTKDISPQEAARGLREHVREAVRVRLRADVDVGIGLSGGLDSSALVVFAAEMSPGIKSYTASFPGTDMDETEYALQVVDSMGGRLDHQCLELPHDAFLGSMDNYVGMIDEPFHAPGVFVNHLLRRRMAKDGLRVILNGAGGDELFGGYPGIFHRPFIASLVRRGKLMQAHRECMRYSESRASFGSRTYLKRMFGGFNELAKQCCPQLEDWRWNQRQVENNACGVVDFDVQPRWRRTENFQDTLHSNMTDWQMNYWMRLCQQTSMSIPIEIRKPLLDHRVIEYAFQLPLDYMIKDGWLKWILRKAFEDDLPRGVVWRDKKMGFPTPVTQWLLELKPQLLGVLESTTCPWIRMDRIQATYNEIAQRDPLFLWRMLSVGLWWNRCVQDESLNRNPSIAA